MSKDTSSSSLMPTMMDEIFPLVAKSTQETKSLPVPPLEIVQLAACLLANPIQERIPKCIRLEQEGGQ